MDAANFDTCLGIEAIFSAVTRGLVTSEVSQKRASLLMASATRAVVECLLRANDGEKCSHAIVPQDDQENLVESLVDDRLQMIKPALLAQTRMGLSTGMSPHSARTLIPSEQHLKVNAAKHACFDQAIPLSAMPHSALKQGQRRRRRNKTRASTPPSTRWYYESHQPDEELSPTKNAYDGAASSVAVAESSVHSTISADESKDEEKTAVFSQSADPDGSSIAIAEGSVRGTISDDDNGEANSDTELLTPPSDANDADALAGASFSDTVDRSELEIQVDPRSSKEIELDKSIAQNTLQLLALMREAEADRARHSAVMAQS